VTLAPAPGARPALPREVDVLVVGLGPVGAALSCLLGLHGVRTLVVDRATEILTHPRAIALDHEALRILQLAGLGEGSFSTVPIPVVRLHSPYFREFGQMNTAGRVDGHPKLVTFHQPELESALRRRVAGLPSVQTALGVELRSLSEDEDGVRVTLAAPGSAPHEAEEVRARYVVGTDGANSLVRQLIGLGFRGHTYGEDWLIVDARGTQDPIDHVEFLCNPARPTPHMVAPGGRERWEFMLAPGETREEMEAPEKIRELLAPWGDPDQMIIERTAVYRFHARVVDRFSVGRVFLAGDAAHVTPPFAGQGLVAGLRDAANLAWKLAWVVHGRAAPHILSTYDTERRPHARAMVRAAKALGRLIMPRSAVSAYCIHGAVRALRSIPPARPVFDEMKLKPKNRFRAGLFRKCEPGASLVGGALFPQVPLGSPDGSVVPSDDALGPALSLVGFGVEAAPLLGPRAEAAFRAAGGAILEIAPRDDRGAPRPDRWRDVEGALLPSVAPAGWVAIVRPDRTVMHGGPAADVTRLVSEALDRLGAVAPPAAPRPVPARPPDLGRALPSSERTS